MLTSPAVVESCIERIYLEAVFEGTVSASQQAVFYCKAETMLSWFMFWLALPDEGILLLPDGSNPWRLALCQSSNETYN